MLRVEKENIVDSRGQKIILKGLNLGGWLMMEGYILGGSNIPQHQFEQEFAQRLGRKELKNFLWAFRENFITETDFRNIKSKGFNCLRVPFNCRLISGKEGILYLDKVVTLSKKYKLYCILDMHAAPGSQNQDWHSDSAGESLLWKNKRNQKEFLNLWGFIVDRYKDQPYVAGYDVLNEPVNRRTSEILALYKEAVRFIRRYDKNHILFLEGNLWAQEVEFLGSPWVENLVYSIHFYQPLDFVFNFVRNLQYPGFIQGRYWSRETIEKTLLRYYCLKKKWRLPIYVGEFGQNSKCTYCHQEIRWLLDTLQVFKKFGFHWTYWTYKATAAGIYPDGLYQYQRNPLWLNRQGPQTGWRTYYNLWSRFKKQIIQSWRTKNFIPNKTLLAVLTSFI
jgi:aryl-phospho-beta-D-glucosidase BglC (GH1 family)